MHYDREKKSTAKLCTICGHFHSSTKQVRIKLQETDEFTFFPTILKQDIQCMKHSLFWHSSC